MIRAIWRARASRAANEERRTVRLRLVVVVAIAAVLGGLGVTAGARGAPPGRYIVLLKDSVASPASVASTARPTASVLPTGPSFVGKERIAAVGLASGRGVSCPLLVIKTPQWAQKRFSGRLACRQSGQGMRSSICLISLFSPNLFARWKGAKTQK